jgi:hypothetical protein
VLEEEAAVGGDRIAAVAVAVAEVASTTGRVAALTPGGYPIGHMDHTGCHVDHTGTHQLVFLTTRPSWVWVAALTPGGCQDWLRGPYWVFFHRFVTWAIPLVPVRGPPPSAGTEAPRARLRLAPLRSRSTPRAARRAAAVTSTDMGLVCRRCADGK